MGKRIITQKRGKGGPRYRSPSHRFTGNVKYPAKSEYREGIGGQVMDITRDSGRTAPIAKILLEDFTEMNLIATEGLRVGQWINFCQEAKTSTGNVMPLGDIPEGTIICNIELSPGDGGKIVKAGGTAAAVVSHDRILGITYVRLPSKKAVPIKSGSRATIGKVAAGGRTDKPMLRAGQNYYKHSAKSKLYPRVRGVAMNACNHPHGGGSHGYTGRPASVARNTPPGRKVGIIAPKRSGRKKR